MASTGENLPQETPSISLDSASLFTHTENRSYRKKTLRDKVKHLDNVVTQFIRIFVQQYSTIKRRRGCRSKLGI